MFNENDKIKNIDKISNFNQKLNDLVIKTMESEFMMQENMKNYFIALQMSKAQKTHKAIMLLCENDFGEDACILTRSIFEIAIIILDIFKEDTKNQLDRYFNYNYIIVKDILNIAKNAKYDTKITKEEEEKIIKNAELVTKKFGYKDGWSDKSIRKRAENVGKINDYNLIYKDLCGVSHTDSTSLLSFGKLDKNNEIKIGSEKNFRVELCLFPTFEYFMVITDKWNEVLNLSIDEELKKINNDFLKEYEK